MRAPRPRRLFAAVLGLALAALAHAQEEQKAPDVPAGPARIEGRVLIGQGDAPVPGVEVVLYALTADGIPGLRRVQSDAQGRFVFEQVSNAADIAYLVGARYAGIPVPGGRVSFAAGQTSANTDIRVAELTQGAGALRIREQTLRLYREADALRVEETFAIENSGERIVYVAEAARGKATPGLRASLPNGASDFRMPLGVVPEGLARDGSAVRYYGPFYPGAQDLVYAYQLAPTRTGEDGAAFALEITPAAGVEKLIVLVPDGAGALAAPGLASAGPSEDAGRRVLRYEAARPRAPLRLAFEMPRARIDPAAISVPEVRIVLHADDAAIRVTETHLLDVGGEGVVLGTAESPLLRVPLPLDASDVRLGSEAPGLEFAPRPDGGVAVLGTVSPGEIPVQLAYRVPVAAAGARLARRFATPVPLLSVFVADTGRLAPRSARLHPSRPVRTEDLSYLALEAFDLAAGEEISLELERLAPRRGVDPRVAKPAAGVAAAALISFLLLPLLRGGAAAPLAAREEPAASERDALYEAIRDLDHDFETGKVSAEDHDRLRAELRARAVELLRAEEGKASEARSEGKARAESASPGEARAQPQSRESTQPCASCGAPAAAAHRFCAQCGAPLQGPRGAPA